MGAFLTLAGRVAAENRVRGSRFIAFAAPAVSEHEAEAVLGERSRGFFDATHHCAAWLFQDGTWRAMDAGEPSGSAGAPILAAIRSLELVDVVVVVTRYFGGTKLGVGGLVRAYSAAAVEVLERAPKLIGETGKRSRLLYAYEDTPIVMRALDRFGALEVEHGFLPDGGQASVTFSLGDDQLPGLRDWLTQESSGRLSLDALGSTVLYRPRRIP